MIKYTSAFYDRFNMLFKLVISFFPNGLKDFSLKGSSPKWGVVVSIGLHLSIGLILFYFLSTHSVFVTLSSSSQDKHNTLDRSTVIWSEPVASLNTKINTTNNTLNQKSILPNPVLNSEMSKQEPSNLQTSVLSQPAQTHSTTKENWSDQSNQTTSLSPEKPKSTVTHSGTSNNSINETIVDTPPNANASYLNNTPPVYPLISRRLQEEGTVHLYTCISNQGEVQQISISKSSGYRRLDESALNAVKGWRFIPAKRAGVTVEHCYQLPIRFYLNN
jgi:TonB family protein